MSIHPRDWTLEGMAHANALRTKVGPMFERLGQRASYRLAKRLIDEAFQRYRQDRSKTKVQCRDNDCFSCCLYQTRVTSTKYEVNRILNQIQNEGRLETVVARARRLVDGGKGGVCPLLSREGRCTVYKIRPLKCAAHHSLDREDCKDPNGRTQHNELLWIETELLATQGMFKREEIKWLKGLRDEDLPNLFDLLAELGQERLDKKEAA